MKANFLLILACSNLKNQSMKLLPALERYNGGAYKVVRKIQREDRFSSNIDIKIISAEFGLIDSKKLIPFYDRKMNSYRARELKSQIQLELKQTFLKNYYTEVYIDLGQQYLTTLENLCKPQETKFLIAEGRIGERMASLKKWLLSHSQ